MSEFLAAYGLWLLIALLIVIVVMFLISGKAGSTPTAVAQPSTPRADPLPPTAPVSELAAEPIAESVPLEPVTLVSGATTTLITPVPEEPAAPPAMVAAAALGTADNLLLLKGVGPKLNTLLIDLGVTRFDQIAAWSDADLAAIDARLGTFKGRPVRDHWIDQAKYLAAGDTAGFETKYGKL